MNPTILRAACTIAAGCKQAEFPHAKTPEALRARAAYAAFALDGDINTSQALARVGWSIGSARKNRLRFRKMATGDRCALERAVKTHYNSVRIGLELI